MTRRGQALAPVGLPEAPAEVAVLVAGVDAALGLDPHRVGPAVLGAGIVTVLEQSARLQAALWQMLAAFDDSDAATVFGQQYTSTFLTAHTTLTASQAAGMTRTGVSLVHRLPATWAAAAAGRISEGHVRQIRWAARMVPEFAAVEADVVGYAADHTVTETRVFLQTVVDQYRPDGSATAAETAAARRYLQVVHRYDGYAVDGFLDPAGGAKLVAFLAEHATACGPDDMRTAGQRRADALVEALELAAGSPATGPSVTLTVTVDADTLAADGPVTLPGGHVLSRRRFQLLACQASVHTLAGRLLADGRVVPLAMGRATRLATAGQRRALAARDRGCIHHGCTRPPRRCHAHHITEWDKGGKTDLTNLVLLCPYHHAMLHLGRFQIITDPDQPGCYLCVYPPPRHLQAV